jgi:MFS family permease
VIVDLIGFGIVMPALPFYAQAYGAGGVTLGVIMTSYAAMQFLLAPLWGRLSDRFGRRPVLLVTVAGTAVSLFLFALADSIAGIVAARLLGGAFAANLSVASAYIADATPESERTRFMGLLGASFGVGFVLGPAIAFVLAPWGVHVPIFAAAALAAANWLHALVGLREPEAHAARLEDGPAAGRFAALRDPLVRRLCTANLVFSLGVAQLEAMFALYVARRFGWELREVAFVLVGMALLMGAIQGGGMKALSARFSERALVVAGSALLAVAFVTIPEMPTPAMLLVPLSVSAVGRAISQPALMSLASLAAPPDRRGSVMGAFQSSASLARVLGPLAAGLLFDLAIGAPFWLAGALLLAVAALGRTLPARVAEQEAVGAAAHRGTPWISPSSRP